MKKRILAFVLSTVLISCFPISTKAATLNKIPTEEKNQLFNVDEYDIENLLFNYFSDNLESEKQKKPLQNSSLLPGSLLDKHNKLTYELKGKVNEEYKTNIKYYTSNVKINSIEKVGEYIKVNADNNVILQYDQVVGESSYIDDHILYIKKYKGKLYIEKDITSLDSSAEDFEAYLNKQKGMGDKYYNHLSDEIDYIENSLNNYDEYISGVRKDVKSISEGNAQKSPRSGLYNWKAAAQWAYDNVNSAEDYDNADCTNFVSKALAYGGVPKDNTWYLHSNAWIRVAELRNWLLNKNYANEYGVGGISFATTGSLVQFRKVSNSLWTHTTIATSYTLGGMPLLSAHSKARRNVALSTYYPTANFNSYRVLFIKY